MVRLSDAKLLAYLLISLLAEAALLSVVQAVDPLTVRQHAKQGELRDSYFFFCGTDTTGVALLGTLGGIMVSAHAGSCAFEAGGSFCR